MAGYHFSLPPLTMLTTSQAVAIDDPNQIAICGAPGTGKSVVALYRHLRICGNHKKSLLLTYTTTLAKYLSACCRLQNSTAALNVKSAYRGRPRTNSRFDEIIVDEAQDLDEEYFDELSGYKVSYGADDSQILYPSHCSTQEELSIRYPDNEEHVLDKNFRNTKSIMEFAKVVFPNAYIPRTLLDSLSIKPGESKPSFLITNGDNYEFSNSKQDNAIKEIINTFRSGTHNIAILVPFKNDVKKFCEILDNLGVEDYSFYYEDKDIFPSGAENINDVHITTFKSAKGLEFDTVIIPNFQKKNSICGQYNIEWSDYYVAATRARSNLYIISNDDDHSLHNVTEVVRL